MKWMLVILLCYLTSAVTSQVLLQESQQDFVLSDRQKVSVMSTEDCSTCYYYLPMNFRLSTNKKNQNEISFTSWKNDENSETIGAILHFLTVWGLTPRQEQELQNRLNERLDSAAYLMGAVSLELNPEHMYLEFVGKEEVVDILKKSLSSSARVASTPGSKMGLSFRFDESNIDTVLGWLKKPNKTDTDLELNLVFSCKSGYSYLQENLVLTLAFENLFKQLSE